MLMMAAGCGTEATNDRPTSVTLIQPEAAVQTPAATAATTDAAAATTTQRTSAGSQTPTTAHSAGAAVDEAAHPDDASPAPNASETVCDAGEVMLAQYISDGDDGCRPEACELGRNRQGGCLRPEIEVPKTTLAPPTGGRTLQAAHRG